MADSILFNALSDCRILYFTLPRNIPHVREFFGPNVQLMEYMPAGATEIWITQTLVGTNRNHLPPKFWPGCRPHPTLHIYEAVYLDHFRRICRDAGVDCPFTSTMEICHAQPELDEPGDSWDWLIVNSQCLSQQLDHWDEPRLARAALSLPGKVVTTHPVHGLPCTREIAPRLWDIAKLAGRCRFIVGINTGPFWACMTRKALANTERIVVLDQLHGFSYGGKAVWARNYDEFDLCLHRLQRPASDGREDSRSPFSSDQRTSLYGLPVLPSQCGRPE
jgi:hypothetical protein